MTEPAKRAYAGLGQCSGMSPEPRHRRHVQQAPCTALVRLTPPGLLKLIWSRKRLTRRNLVPLAPANDLNTTKPPFSGEKHDFENVIVSFPNRLGGWVVEAHRRRCCWIDDKVKSATATGADLVNPSGLSLRS